MRIEDLPERYRKQAEAQLSGSMRKQIDRPKPTANELMRRMGFVPSQGNVPRTDYVASVVKSGIRSRPKPSKLVEVPYEPSEVFDPPRRTVRKEMSSPEKRFQAEILHGLGRYEAITLKLDGGSRYTPDFFFMDGDVPVLVEVKGNFRLGSEGRAHTAFMEASAQYPMFRFVWAILGKKGVWDIKMVLPALGEEEICITEKKGSKDEEGDV